MTIIIFFNNLDIQNFNIKREDNITRIEDDDTYLRIYNKEFNKKEIARFNKSEISHYQVI